MLSVTVSSVLTSSTGFGSGNSYAGSDSSYHMPSYKYETSKNFDATKQTLDNQLKEIDSQLDSQLLSKVGEQETFYWLRLKYGLCSVQCSAFLENLLNLVINLKLMNVCTEYAV